MSSARRLHLVLVVAIAFAVTGCGGPTEGLRGGIARSSSPSADPLSSSPSPLANPSGPPSSSVASPSTKATRSGGKPHAGNTGVPAGTRLTVVTGDQVFSTSGQVVEGKDFRGFVRVTGANVVFRRCVFRGRAVSHNAALLDTSKGSNTLVEDSEFVPSHPAATIDGISASNTVITRVNIHGSVDGVKTGSNVVIQDSYIHNLTWFASDPNQGGGPTHNDGVQSFLGDTRVTLRHNTIDVSAERRANATFQNSASAVRVENNWLDGGGCTLNFNHVNSPLTNLYVLNNRFGRHSFFNCPILISTQTTLTQNSGNVWDDTGSPIPKPQQHD